jgi:hypothetical protein
MYSECFCLFGACVQHRAQGTNEAGTKRGNDETRCLPLSRSTCAVQLQLSSAVSNLACFHPVLPLSVSLCLHCTVHNRTCISMARLTLHYPFARKRQEPEWPQPSRANLRGAVVMRRRHCISVAKTFYLIRSAFPTSAAQQHGHDGVPPVTAQTNADAEERCCVTT